MYSGTETETFLCSAQYGLETKHVHKLSIQHFWTSRAVIKFACKKIAHLIDTHSQINTLCLINGSPLMLSLYCPHDNYSKILGKSKKKRNLSWRPHWEAANHYNYSLPATHKFLSKSYLPRCCCHRVEFLEWQFWRCQEQFTIYTCYDFKFASFWLVSLFYIDSV